MPLDAPSASQTCPNAACKFRFSTRDHKGSMCYKCGKELPAGLLSVGSVVPQSVVPAPAAAPGSPATWPWRKDAISDDRATLEELYKQAESSEKLGLEPRVDVKNSIARVDARITETHRYLRRRKESRKAPERRRRAQGKAQRRSSSHQTCSYTLG